jgi:hypothetical protein
MAKHDATNLNSCFSQSKNSYTKAFCGAFKLSGRLISVRHEGILASGFYLAPQFTRISIGNTPPKTLTKTVTVHRYNHCY